MIALFAVVVTVAVDDKRRVGSMVGFIVEVKELVAFIVVIDARDVPTGRGRA